MISIIHWIFSPRNLHAHFSIRYVCLFQLYIFLFQIIIRITPSQEEMSLNVQPFTTIQYLQHFMFSQQDASSFAGLSAVPNKRFATKSRLSLNGIILSSQMTIYEVITKYGVVGHESNVFDHQYIFLYQEYEVHFPPNGKLGIILLWMRFTLNL